MPGKRKRAEATSSSTLDSAKPLSAIAAARLKAEAAAKGVITPEITVDPVIVSSISPQHGPRFSDAESESESEQEEAFTKPNDKLCNWRETTSTILSHTRSELTIDLDKHTTIALIGCYELTVLRGAVHINGANLSTVSRQGEKNRAYRVYASATNPIFKIRGLDASNHVRFVSCNEPTPLSNVNSLFANIWNGVPMGRSFSIITNSDADPLSRTLIPDSAPEDWLRAIEDCAVSSSITLVAGPANSGKSVFAKRLINRYLTGLGKTARPATAIAYLDLNPKKQEYMPGGQISLVLVRDLNLGPSFTHPAITSNEMTAESNKVIRAHFVPTNVTNYTDYYQMCVEDLFLAFKNLQSRDATLSLVIDTLGSLSTSDFESLKKLLTRTKPQNIVQFHAPSAMDVENAGELDWLQTFASQYRSSIHHVRAHSSLSAPMRTEAELRTMQMQSYFHLLSSSTSPGRSLELSWATVPLSQLVPWEFCYEDSTERTQDFVGFAMYSEPIEPVSLVHALNGSVVHIVQSTSSVIPRPYTALPRTSKLHIPYFAPHGETGMTIPLDPRTSNSVCAALIRGFDPARKVVHVLVPKLHESRLYSLAPDRTVFVGECCDMPEWAFQEDVYTGEGMDRSEQSGMAEPGDHRHLWLEKEGIVEDMGYLNTVRRVRKYQT